MARLSGSFQFIGSLDGFSAYREEGSDKIIVRSKGGPSKEQIKNHPNLERTRENYGEFDGCSKAGKQVRMACHPLMHLGDRYVSGRLTGFMKQIQLADTIGRRGERSVRIAQYRRVLEGFNLNRHILFDSVIRQPLLTSISREELLARVTLPTLVPGLNFLPQGQPFLFRIIAALGTVSDIEHTSSLGYQPIITNDGTDTAYTTTEWSSTSKGLQEQSLLLQLNKKDKELDESQSLVVSIGVELGMPVNTQEINLVKKTGCGKILATG
jgi:hypothetical protein